MLVGTEDFWQLESDEVYQSVTALNFLQQNHLEKEVFTQEYYKADDLSVLYMTKPDYSGNMLAEPSKFVTIAG